MSQIKSLYSESHFCEFPGCRQDATEVASGHKTHPNGGAGYYCEAHARIVAKEDHAEYVLTCVNCGCIQGVN